MKFRAQLTANQKHYTDVRRATSSDVLQAGDKSIRVKRDVFLLGLALELIFVMKMLRMHKKFTSTYMLHTSTSDPYGLCPRISGAAYAGEPHWVLRYSRVD